MARTQRHHRQARLKEICLGLHFRAVDPNPKAIRFSTGTFDAGGATFKPRIKARNSVPALDPEP